MPENEIMPVSCLFYCRGGFEKEMSAEAMQHFTKQQIQGYIKAKTDSAFISFHPTSTTASTLDLHTLNQSLSFEQLIFARQAIFILDEIQIPLPKEEQENTQKIDRITPILDSIKNSSLRFCATLLETPDTNEGKQLSGFCKKFVAPFERALKSAELINPKSPWRLHLFFIDSNKVYIGVSHLNNSSPYEMGISRLRMPKAAPSRSTLKLDEAFKTMLSDAEQTQYLRNGMTAVDLGACPGGWTWQLVQRDILVTAIDNGPMESKLMASGMVKHIMEDGFKYLPKDPVDWLVCDMVERPLHIARLMARWLSEGHCQHAAFNLKLPMKKRYDMVIDCKDAIEGVLQECNRYYTLRIKHLYHDREEVTCIVL